MAHHNNTKNDRKDTNAAAAQPAPRYASVLAHAELRKLPQWDWLRATTKQRVSFVLLLCSQGPSLVG